MQIKRISLYDANNQPLQGIEMFLGPTEARIMRSIWAKPKGLKHLLAEFITDDDKDLSQSTIHTTLTRLVEKGMLRKAPFGVDVLYRPTFANEKTFLNDALQQLDRALRENFNVRVR